MGNNNAVAVSSMSSLMQAFQCLLFYKRTFAVSGHFKKKLLTFNASFSVKSNVCLIPIPDAMTTLLPSVYIHIASLNDRKASAKLRLIAMERRNSFRK